MIRKAQTTETFLILLGQYRDDNWQLSVLTDEAGRCLFIAETAGEFLGRSGPQVWAISNKETARYYAGCFAIPEPELFIEHCPHFEFLGTPDEVFPGGLSWQTHVDGPRELGSFDEGTGEESQRETGR